MSDSGARDAEGDAQELNYFSADDSRPSSAGIGFVLLVPFSSGPSSDPESTGLYRLPTVHVDGLPKSLQFVRVPSTSKLVLALSSSSITTTSTSAPSGRSVASPKMIPSLTQSGSTYVPQQVASDGSMLKLRTPKIFGLVRLTYGSNGLLSSAG